MPRYATRPPKADDDREPWEYEHAFTPPLNVDLKDAETTGLLDKRGHDIVRMPDAIGFIKARKCPES